MTVVEKHLGELDLFHGASGSWYMCPDSFFHFPSGLKEYVAGGGGDHIELHMVVEDEPDLGNVGLRGHSVQLR